MPKLNFHRDLKYPATTHCDLSEKTCAETMKRMSQKKSLAKLILDEKALGCYAPKLL